ncbi:MULTISPECIES: Ntn hydrolase family protein [Deferrisoma]
MSQLVGCAWTGGVVLAADRRVTVGTDEGEQTRSVRKLYPLGHWAAAATAGAAVGIGLTRRIARAFHGRAAPFLDEIEPYILKVFCREYEAFVQQGARWFAAHPEAHQRSYLLLGGKDSAGAFRIAFYASEAHDCPHAPLPVGNVVTAPRRLGLEARLAQELAGEPAPGAVEELVAVALRRIAQRDEAVGGPFDLAVLDSHGLRFETLE